MATIPFIEDQYQQLLAKRNEILQMPASLAEKHQMIIKAAQAAIIAASGTIREASLTKEEEVILFKAVLPPLYALTIYHIVLWDLETTKPVTSSQSIRDFYTSAFKRIDQYTAKQADFYRYIRGNSTFLDDYYFTRQSEWDILSGELFTPFLDPLCCSIGTYKMAMLKAYEQVAEYLRNAISLLDNPDKSGNDAAVLEWTDSKSGLIELIYALQEKGSFNNGRASLKQITAAFEAHFKVELGNTSRTFQVIMSRKMEYANFLEKLKQRFLQRIDRNEQKHIK